MMMRLSLAIALTAALLVGCTNFPELDRAISPAARNADFPDLLPIDQLIADAQNTQINETTVPGIEGRVARLRARAARLRGPVVDRKTRARMRRAIARHS